LYNLSPFVINLYKRCSSQLIQRLALG
jgi:hypothetical protein